MRLLLHLPEVSTENLSEVCELMIQIVDMLNGYDARANTHGQITFHEDGVEQSFQEKLARLNLLTGKVNSPLILAEALQKNALKDVAMQALQPKPPVLLDLTVEEVAKLIAEIIKPGIKAYQVSYYIELLRNSLLLPEAQDYIEHPENWGLPSNADIEVIARKMYEDANQDSRIVVK